MTHRVMMIISVIACLAIMNAPAGADWVPQPPGILPINHMTRSLHVVDSNTIWAVSDTTDPSFFTYTPRVARSTDAGSTWNVSTIPGTIGYLLIDVFALDASTAWVAAFDLTATEGGIYKTTDGGTSWVRQLTGPWIWVTFFDALNGVAVSTFTTPRARTTTDGGATWQSAPAQPALDGAFLHTGNNSRAVVGNTMWVVGYPGRIFRSTDRGYHWTQQSTALPVDKVLSIAFSDASNGLVATWELGQSHTARTTDGGQTWTALVAPSQPRAYCVTDVPQTSGGYVMVAGEEDAPFVGDYGGSTYTLDSGATWISVDDVFHSGVDFVDPTTGWAGGSSTQTTSGLYKWAGTALGIDAQGPAPGLQFYMSQNYPNPFSGKTSIRFDLPNAGPMRLAVYDVLGREVDTLVDGVQAAGVHVIDFDATRLSSGVYYCRLEGTRTIEARSMLVTR